MREIKTYFMKLTNDPKLKVDDDADRSLLCENDDRVGDDDEMRVRWPEDGVNLCA